jgi:hypothetical protein
MFNKIQIVFELPESLARILNMDRHIVIGEPNKVMDDKVIDVSGYDFSNPLKNELIHVG